MKYWLSMVLIALTLSLIVARPGDPGPGKAVYTKSCASCHGAAGEGKDAIAKVLKVEMRHLGSTEVQEKSDEKLRKDTVEGIGKMKPVKGLSEENLDNLIAYLRTLAKE